MPTPRTRDIASEALGAALNIVEAAALQARTATTHSDVERLQNLLDKVAAALRALRL